MPIGRPPKYSTPEELEAIGKAWKDQTLASNEPLTITGLALALGFTSRLAVINYEVKPDFVNAVKRIKLQIEAYAERRAMDAKGNPAGPIFALKNYGWSDRQDVSLSTPNPLKIDTNIEIVLRKVDGGNQ